MVQELNNDLVLLWELAEEMATGSSKTRAECWLELMDAFWQGDFALSGLTLWQSDPALQGGEKFRELTRDDLVVAALGEPESKRLGLGASCRQLLDWNLQSYATVRSNVRYIFSVGEEKRGLCVSRAEFERWKSKSDRSMKSEHIAPLTSQNIPKKIGDVSQKQLDADFRSWRSSQEACSREDIRNWGRAKFGDRVTLARLDALDKDDAASAPRRIGRKRKLSR